MSKNIKIGILTYHRAINYGAFLQAYALCERLNQEVDICAELIDYQTPEEADLYNPWKIRRNFVYLLRDHDLKRIVDNINRYFIFRRALKKMRLSEQYLKSDDAEKFLDTYKEQYDIILVGSDEVWKIDSYRGFSAVYWLPGNYGSRKIAYAVSARNDFSCMEQEDLLFVKQMVGNFDIISVRDEMTYREARRLTEGKKEILRCCDPSFLYEFEADGSKGRKILRERYGVDTKKRCIGLMICSQELVEVMRARWGGQIELISLFERNEGTIFARNLSPFEWLDVVAGLDLMITSYFHGMCFSVITGTPFYAVDNRCDEEEQSKMKDFLENEDLEERYFATVKNSVEQNLLLERMDRDFRSGKMDSSKIIMRNRKIFMVFLKRLRSCVGR